MQQLTQIITFALSLGKHQYKQWVITSLTRSLTTFFFVLFLAKGVHPFILTIIKFYNVAFHAANQLSKVKIKHKALLIYLMLSIWFRERLKDTCYGQRPFKKIVEQWNWKISVFWSKKKKNWNPCVVLSSYTFSMNYLKSPSILYFTLSASHRLGQHPCITWSVLHFLLWHNSFTCWT